MMTMGGVAVGGGSQWELLLKALRRPCKLAKLVLMASDSLKGASQFLKQSPASARYLPSVTLLTISYVHSCTPNIPPVNAHYVTIKKESRPSLGQIQTSLLLEMVNRYYDALER